MKDKYLDEGLGKAKSHEERGLEVEERREGVYSIMKTQTKSGKLSHTTSMKPAHGVPGLNL